MGEDFCGSSLRKAAQLIGQVVFTHYKVQLECPLQFPGDAANSTIQSHVILQFMDCAMATNGTQ